MRMLVSDMAGRASIELKGRELGFDLSDQREVDAATLACFDRVKDMELRGYTFDAADASFELLLRRRSTAPCRLLRRRVLARHHRRHAGSEALSEATVKLTPAASGSSTGEGNGPVNALDHALRSALARPTPRSSDLELIDYKVRILDASHGTDA
jgi:2-isopropylmalate synthase